MNKIKTTQDKICELFRNNSFPENYHNGTKEFLIPSTADLISQWFTGFMVSGDKVAIVKPSYLKLTNKLYIKKGVIYSDWPHAKIYHYKNYTEEQIIQMAADFIETHKKKLMKKRMIKLKQDF